VRDAYGRGKYLVLDLYGAPQQAESGSTAAPILAQQLQAVLERLPRFLLGSSELGRHLDRDLGVQLLLPDGRLTQVG